MIDFLLHFFALSLVIIPVMLPLSLTLLTWLTPQSVIDRYVCPPHFSEFESVAYRYFPTSCIRTLLFQWQFQFQSSDESGSLALCTGKCHAVLILRAVCLFTGLWGT